jgi:ATP-binding cassette subfamily B (MDR/TAP) protein 6
MPASSNIVYGQPSTILPDENTISSSAQAAQMQGREAERGEKQWVAIARTMVKKPRVLLLEEATSAMGRGMSKGALGRLVNGRSCLSIAHLLSTTKAADL